MQIWVEYGFSIHALNVSPFHRHICSLAMKQMSCGHGTQPRDKRVQCSNRFWTITEVLELVQEGTLWKCEKQTQFWWKTWRRKGLAFEMFPFCPVLLHVKVGKGSCPCEMLSVPHCLHTWLTERRRRVREPCTPGALYSPKSFISSSSSSVRGWESRRGVARWANRRNAMASLGFESPTFPLAD
jgi:hypothetical protein